MARPLFSILHPSARPDQWRKVYYDWMSKCVDPAQVEYVLCIDQRWGFMKDAAGFRALSDWETERGGLGRKVAENSERRCYVDAVNTAAKAATGQILIVIADDQFGCERWDDQLKDLIPFCAGDGIDADFWALDREFVLEVSTGTPQEHERGIFVMPIVSRARYERLGYLFYPEYESMFADNDLCEHARQDGVVIDARHLMFPHRHPILKGGDWTTDLDAVYKAQMRSEAWKLGESVLKARRLCGFKTRSEAHSYFESPTLELPKPELSRKPTLVICYPGEQFSGDWVDGFINLINAAVARGFLVQPLRAYTSNPYMTRMDLCSMVMAEDPKPDFVLFIDDDNVATPEQLFMLLDDLQDHPDVDVMTGWCWIHITDKHLFLPSCGVWHENGTHITPYEGRLWSKATEVSRIDWTGFPFLLMRGGTLEKAGGRNAFLPILDESLPHGMSGEDIGWCKRAGAAGLILAADPRVRVDHLKLVSAEPYMPAPSTEMVVQASLAQSSDSSWPASTVATMRNEPRIAAMLRVKNEARWIKRVIEAITPLCDAGIFVLDDVSTDSTWHIANAAGATIYTREDCPGEGLDESRDKNWLMAQIVSVSNPDWILCIDGDEELQPGGAEKIREALRDTQMDSFTLNVPYLWNSPDTIRVDGIYRDVKRHSLFRPLSGLTFQSLYAGSGTHSGLHSGNVPVWVRKPESTGVIDVNLWHYGYMLKEDRIRKYEWYNRIDPNNEIENRYRHTVQGDIPEVPADEIWRNAQTGRVLAGPLQLEKLPAEIAPKWDAPKGRYQMPSPEIPGWMSAEELQWLFEQAGQHENIVEIGSWMGRSTHALLTGTKGKVIAVDTFQGSPAEPAQRSYAQTHEVFDEFTRYMRGFPNLRVVKMSSIRAALFVADEYFDMIFIDGEHTYEAVLADLKAWLPKLKPGGLICGHDYSDAPGVKLAVDLAFDARAVQVAGSIWAYWAYRVPQSIVVSWPSKADIANVRLNLGCSDRLEPGFVNVDICDPADQLVDLRGKWPWETGSVSEIRAWDIIEHLPDRIHTMNEAFRVLKPGGRLDIIVPTTDGRGAFQDPTHVSFWNRNSFFYFESGNPHLTRFEKAYGMRCAFRVLSDQSETLRDGVTKLHIILEAAEREAFADAAD